MTEITEKELLRRLESLDEETLLFLWRYSSQRRRLARTSTIVSALFASIAGLVMTVAFLFPESNKALVTIVSTILGAAIAWLGIWERKREEVRLISQLLKESEHERLDIGDTHRKRELIERFLKAEGL